MESKSQIDGPVPHLAGKVCEGLFAWQLSYCGEVIDSAHLVFLKVAGQWYQFYLDYECAYWQTISDLPAVHLFQDDKLSFELVDLLADFGLNGEIIRWFEAGRYRRGPGCMAKLE